MLVARGPAEGEGVDLGQLIDTHRGRRSYADLSRDCGDIPSAKRLQQIVTQSMKAFPDADTVRALARGLRLSQSVIVLAAAESLGLDVRKTAPRVVELLPAAADELSEQQAAAIAHLVRTIVEERPTQSDDDDEYFQEGPEPTVKEVLAARAHHERQLRAVAQGGEDLEQAEGVDELAQRARAEQEGPEA